MRGIRRQTPRKDRYLLTLGARVVEGNLYRGDGAFFVCPLTGTAAQLCAVMPFKRVEKVANFYAPDAQAFMRGPVAEILYDTARILRGGRERPRYALNASRRATH